MGICDEGQPIKLVFDCISYGKNEINTGDELKLKSALNKLSKIINVPTSDMIQVLYNYELLDINRTVKELGLPNGAVITVKFRTE